MAGWTKEDFDNNYSIRVERYMGGHPNTRPEVRLCYHRSVMVPILQNRWDKLIPDILPIQADDLVVLVGAGFGWGVEILKQKTGAKVIGTDISDWVESVKDTSEEAEIDACIRKVGLEPGTGRGLEIKRKYFVPGPRCTVKILNEDLATEDGRKNLLRVLGQTPDWIITEDFIQTFSDEEARTFHEELRKIKGAKIVHLGAGGKIHEIKG